MMNIHVMLWAFLSKFAPISMNHVTHWLLIYVCKVGKSSKQFFYNDTEENLTTQQQKYDHKIKIK